MNSTEKEKDGEILFFIEPLDPKTNQVISQMFTELELYLKKFFYKNRRKTFLPTPVWECRYQPTRRIVI